MSRRAQIPAWIPVAVISLVAILVFRYALALDSGVSHSVALRTYIFWALVCIPVAILGDILVRTISDYRIVRLTLARVKSRR